jgi:hypothetical protein
MLIYLYCSNGHPPSFLRVLCLRAVQYGLLTSIGLRHLDKFASALIEKIVLALTGNWSHESPQLTDRILRGMTDLSNKVVLISK